jgi:HAD superfamily hydrolase (TIGR01459 family)
MFPNPSPEIIQPPRFIGGLRDLAADYDVILCDVWGVVHNGVIQYEKATDALRRFREKGGSVVLITNAPRPRWRVVSLLDRLKVPHEAYDGAVSSGDVTVSLIRERGDLPLAYIGPQEDVEIFTEAEAQLGHKLKFVRLDEAAYVVCIGLEQAERETPADYEARLRLLRSHDAEFICANPDIVVEMGDRLVYCAGALAEAYEALGGRVIQAGKPHAEIYRRALALAATARGGAVDPGRVLAIGDSAHTDIKGAQAQGLATLFVTSGIHRAELHDEAGSGPLNAAALHQFVENLDFKPMAVATELMW